MKNTVLQILIIQKKNLNLFSNRNHFKSFLPPILTMDLTEYGYEFLVDNEHMMEWARRLAEKTPINILSPFDDKKRGLGNYAVLEWIGDGDYDLIVYVDRFEERMGSEKYEQVIDLLTESRVLTENEFNQIRETDHKVLREMLVPTSEDVEIEDYDLGELLVKFTLEGKKVGVLFQYWSNLPLLEYNPTQ